MKGENDDLRNVFYFWQRHRGYTYVYTRNQQGGIESENTYN